LSGNQGIERKRAVKDESWTTKRVLIFLPGNANVYSIKEGDLHTTMISKKRRRKERRGIPRGSRGRTESRGSTRLRRDKGERNGKRRKEDGGDGKRWVSSG
jgi:hypothetical protein